MEQPSTHVVQLSGGYAFACAEGETILRAGLRAGLNMAYECASGSCGSCKCRLLDGEVQSLWPEAPGLSPRDRVKGDRLLACQTTPTSNVRLNLRTSADLEEPAPERYVASVVEQEQLCASVIRLTLKLPRKAVFLPGQFFIVEVPGGGRRAYSMANLPNRDGLLEFLIKNKPGGAFSRLLFDRTLQVHHLSVEGPYGRAFLRVQSDRPIVAVAGGSGLAPVLSIMRAAASTNLAHPMHLYFGLNAEADLFCLSELQDLARTTPNLQVHVALRDEAASLDGVTCTNGLVGDAMLANESELATRDLYLAGPSAMVNDLVARTVRPGLIPADRVFYDRFD